MYQLPPTQVDSGTVKRAYAQFRSLKYNVTNIHSFAFVHQLNIVFAFRLVRLGFDVEQSGKDGTFAKVLTLSHITLGYHRVAERISATKHGQGKKKERKKW